MVDVYNVGMCRVTCAHCHDTFLFNTLNNALARCPHCRFVVVLLAVKTVSWIRIRNINSDPDTYPGIRSLV